MPNTLQNSIQDTTGAATPKIQISTEKPQIGGSFDLNRQTIELSSLNRVLDSARIAPKPKKVIPIVKTIPFVPKHDTIPGPEYNTFTGQFDLPKEHKGWEKFQFTPLKPEEAADLKISTTPVEKTSTTQALNVDDVIVTESNLKAKGFGNTDWMLGVIIPILLFYGWLNVRHSKFIKSIWTSSVNFFAARRLQEEANVVRNNVFTLMNVIFFGTTAFLVTLWFEYTHILLLGQHGIILFLIFLGIILLVYGIKTISLAFLDFLFLTKGAFLNYNTNVFIYNKIFGIILLPVVTIIPFVSNNVAIVLFILAVIAFAILYLMRLFRGIQLGIKNRLSILYLILYLCALEIFPVLVIIHTMQQYV